MDEFLPKSPDPRILQESDQTLARFGHLNLLLRKLAFTSEELEVYTDNSAPTGIKPVIIYTLSTNQTVTITNLIPQLPTTILLVNHVSSVGALTVQAIASHTISAGGMIIATFIDGNWYLD